MRFLSLVLAVVLIAGLSACGYNSLQSQDEAVQSAWAEVMNQYKRRADLVPNLVESVKGYAAHEQQAIEAVSEARSKLGSVQVSPAMLENPESFQKYAAAEQSLGSAMSRLIAISENYPNLKADGVFRDLQAQLEGTENRITVARNRFILSVQEYNTTVRSFPTNLTAKIFSHKLKSNFTVENPEEVQKAPKVDFKK